MKPPSTVVEIRDRVNRREISAEEVALQALARIGASDGAIGAFLSRCDQAALQDARRIDQRVAAGEKLPLAGVPAGVKDNLCHRGVATTCGSRILEGYLPPYDATAVTRLRQAGAVVVGKTNLDEFGMGSSSENSAFGPVRNPWNTDRVAGGSSGGSAAAVAAGMVPAALGTDTGGSVRQPASLCGVVGLKPTYGRVSRYGQVAFASSLDQIGPLAATVADCAALLSAIAGVDPRDATSSPEPAPDLEAELAGGVAGLRIGVPREYLGEGVSAEVDASIREALKRFEDLGAETVEISLPNTRYAIAAYYIVANAEASSNLARYDGVRYGCRRPSGTLQGMVQATRSAGFGDEVKRRIMLGTYALSSGYYKAYYLQALKVRRLIRQDFVEAFENVDLIACPTSPDTAFPLQSRIEDPLAMYLSDVFTVTASLAGLPAMSLPCGLSRDGLPIGIQILARHFQEGLLLRAGQALESALAFPRLSPPDSA